MLLQPKAEATSVSVLVEVPLHELQPKPGPAKAMLDVHCSLAALVKDAKGEVVQKLTRDRGFQVTPDQLKLGQFLDKMTVALPAGQVQAGKRGDGSRQRQDGDAAFGIHRAGRRRPAWAISSLVPMRSYTPNAKGLDPNEPFQFQGGSVTPTLDLTVKKAPNAVLRLFFTVYPDAAISAAPAGGNRVSAGRARASRKCRCNCLPPTHRAGFRT